MINCENCIAPEFDCGRCVMYSRHKIDNIKSKRVRRKAVINHTKLSKQLYNDCHKSSSLNFRLWNCDIALLHFCTDWKAKQIDFNKIDVNKLKITK